MLWIGEVADAKSTDDLISSASISGKAIPDLKNHDFKTASELRTTVTGNLEKQGTTVEGKAQSEERQLTDRQLG